MNANLVGTISLNIAVVIYLTQYLPQLYHNKTVAHLKNMSLTFHFIFFIAYLSDFIYAFGMHMPWQYVLVNIVGLIALLIQHRQLTRVYNGMLLNAMLMVFILFFMVGVSFIVIKQSEQFYINMELVSYAGFLTFRMPQLYRNWRLKTGQALSKSYLFLSLACTLCDNISGWCLDWPWPNKLGAFILLIFILLLIGQTMHYRKKQEIIGFYVLK
jgi:hypothetical protein